MLINISNHPFVYWSENQLRAASIYGELTDMPFPVIEPEWEAERVEKCVETFFVEIMKLLAGSKEHSAVHIAGEAVFCYMMVAKLLAEGIEVITSTSRRNVRYEDGNKITEFNFVCFRHFK